MLFHAPTALQVLRTSLRRFGAARASYVAGSGLLHAAVFSAVNVGRGLDHLFHGGHRRQAVDSPVFIVATPRSGTSFLHGLLGLDARRFSHLRLYQTIFPSITLYRMLDRLAAVDRVLGGFGARAVATIDRNSFSSWDTIHPIALDSQEEDEAYFVLTLVSPTLFLVVPYPDSLPVARRADTLSAARLDRIARYYRGCIKRHLYAEGHGRTMLIKNVFHAGRLDLLRRSFPDARIVHLVRHPYEAIGSALSLFHTIWRGHSPEIGGDSPQVRALAEMFCDDYLRLHRAGVERNDRSRHLTVRYEDLVARPRETIEEIYRSFGYSMTPDYSSALAQATDGSRRFRSRHRYALEEFGISREFLHERLDECFQAYGYERESSTISKSAL